MPRFKVAHLHEQGEDMVIVPLEGSFDYKSDEEQQAIIEELQLHSRGAGLKGTVVPVWQKSGRMAFIAPPPWHPFFRSLSLQTVFANVNKEIYW
ncbi:MAG: hypothetical protein WB816_15405 [Methylocystis sp.]